MVKDLDIIEYEDPSVYDLLNKTAKELREKYNKKRKINEKFLKKKTPTQKVFSIFFDILSIIMLIAAFIVCFSIMNTTINGYMPNFAGYSNLVVSSKSMVKSGYNVGDIVIVHSVNTKTLNVDDKIAFYNYAPSYIKFDPSTATDVSSEVSKTKYTLTFKQLFGFQTEEFKKASSAKSKIIFHHIRAIYEDENGTRWFKTYGSSNGSDDSWWVNENYVVGIEDESGVSNALIGLVDIAAKPHGFLVFVIPVIILVIILVFSFLKNVQIAKLELDCVEEKRKITDEICVRNDVGFQMSEKTKLKILAQATDDNKQEYINLLWKKGRVPNGINKYYKRKQLVLNANRDLLNLNRECEKMFKDGVKPRDVAKYYLIQKQKIENRSEAIQKQLKSIDKRKKNENKK